MTSVSYYLDSCSIHDIHLRDSLLAFFSLQNGRFPRRSHRGLKSCKMFILMAIYLLYKKGGMTCAHRLMNQPIHNPCCRIKHFITQTLGKEKHIVSTSSPTSLAAQFFFHMHIIHCLATKMLCKGSFTLWHFPLGHCSCATTNCPSFTCSRRVPLHERSSSIYDFSTHKHKKSHKNLRQMRDACKAQCVTH